MLPRWHYLASTMLPSCFRILSHMMRCIGVGEPLCSLNIVMKLLTDLRHTPVSSAIWAGKNPAS